LKERENPEFYRIFNFNILVTPRDSGTETKLNAGAQLQTFPYIQRYQKGFHIHTP